MTRESQRQVAVRKWRPCTASLGLGISAVGSFWPYAGCALSLSVTTLSFLCEGGAEAHAGEGWLS